MAPLRGLFLADFQDFYNAVLRADAHLVEFAAGADKASSRLNAMVDSFSGRDVIQDATLMAEAIARIGGTSKLTEDELRRVGTTASEASAKLIAMGLDVPPRLQRLAEASRASRGETDLLRDSFSQFSGVLSGLGVNISPQVRAIENIAGAAGKSAGELGLLATAGLAVGTGLAAWGLGRAAADFFDLDTKIGHATAKVLGFGDAVGEAAAAKADVLAKASATAGHAITDLGVAMAINEGNVRGWQKSLDTSAHQVEVWRSEIEGVKSRGTLADLAKDLESHNFTLAEMERRYGLTTRAIQFFERETKAAADAEKEVADIRLHNQEKLQKLQEEIDAHRVRTEAKVTLELTKLEEDYNVRRIQMSGTSSDRQIADIDRWEAVTIAALRKAGTASDEVVAQVHKNAAQMREAAGANFGEIEKYSIRSLEAQARYAQKTFEAATTFAGGMTREGIEHFRQLRDAALDALHGIAPGTEPFISKLTEINAKTMGIHLDLKGWNADIMSATRALDDQVKSVRTLAGEFVTAAEAQRRLHEGGSVQYDLSTPEGRSKVDPKIAAWLHAGYSLAQAAALASGNPINPNDPLWATIGPRVPGFAGGVQNFGGGLAVVGERGPELVNLPAGSDVIPVGGGGGGLTLNVAVSGVWDTRSRAELLDVLSRGLVEKLKAQGWRPPLQYR